jgi:thiosulfate reductase cytochrome b subunit
MKTLIKRSFALSLLIVGVALVVAGLAAGILPAAAQGGEAPPLSKRPMHPVFPLLDRDGANVLTSGLPVSTMTTCGSCHDTTFIASHSFHADVGLSSYGKPAAADKGSHAWDLSLGTFGRWDPVTYRRLSPVDDKTPDLTTAEWLMTLGTRHVGGGPATTSRAGTPLTALRPDILTVETGIVDAKTGTLSVWDWATSGVAEMNCFVCHTANPNNAARIEALQNGQFGWAASATLINTGLIKKDGTGYVWDPDAFDLEGRPARETIGIQDPSSANCGACHGTVHTDAQRPLIIDPFSPAAWSTYTTGQIVSPQRINLSALNLAGKNALSRSWDVHAERVVACVDCHYSLNNPVYYREGADKPAHLTFDPRRMDFGEYLYRPLHQFAKGQSVQSPLAPELDNTLRRCESCHSTQTTHNWLPYKDRHFAEVACETCHIPKVYAPALAAVDWTVLDKAGEPVRTYRGVEGNLPSTDALITGYTPAMLPRQNPDGTTAFAPHNLIAAWYWVAGDPAVPVPIRDLKAVYLDGDGDGYAAAVLAAFDADKDGDLSRTELYIDTPEKQAVIAKRLEGRGLSNPRIVAETSAYSINHGVARGEWANRDCRTCHAEDSRLVAPLALSDRTPGGVDPALPAAAKGTGTLVRDDKGTLFYQTNTAADGLYIFGRDSSGVVDVIGPMILLATLFGVTVHGGLRYFAARRRTPHEPELKRVYMYSIYERQWHWLQTAVIFGLIFTGMVIHKPATFGVFSFPFVVEVHNILAVILVINAALAAFYHLASGEIRQFLPKPYGFFNDAIVQAKYYLWGIFRGQEHPFEKTRQRKLNPLQQATYFMLLNVLLPAQVITGLLMMFAQQWAETALVLGGLPILAPLHTLIAWSLSAFIVGHVYLTTTGHTVTSNIQAMITGWDEVEVHSAPQAGQD